MKLVLIAAFVAVCGAAKLDRAYLPPASAVTAGGSPGSIHTPFAGNSFNQGLGGIPKGSFTNDFDGVVVDAAAPGTRASEGGTGLGAPRLSYGSTNSKVGDAAFKGAAGFRQGSNQNANVDVPSDSQGTGSGFAHASSEAHFEPKQERAQAPYDRVSNTLRFESEVGPESYNFAYETDNGITAEENGVDVNGNHAQGGYSYTGDDGQVYSVTYVADEGGYQPRGDHLPTPPPIPEEILKSLEQNARDEAAGLIDDGSYDAQKYNAGADYAETDVTQVEQNDRQAPTFGKRPESDASVSGTFINQNNQAFVRPSSNEHVQEEMSSTQEFSNNAFQPTSSANAFSQFSQSNQQQVNVFGSRIQPNNKQNGMTYNKPSSNRFDVQSSTRNPSTANNKYPSSISSDVSGQFTHNSGHGFGFMHEYLPPVQGQNGTPQRPITTPQRFGQTSQKFQSTFQDNSPTLFTQSSQVSNGFQQKPQIPINTLPQSGNRPSQSTSFDEQRPTLQPSAELTTPFESNEQSSVSNDFPERETSFNSQKPAARPTSQYENQQNRQPASRPSFNTQSQSFAQKPQSQGQYHTDEVEYAPSTVKPSFNQQQKQGPDSSYYYKQPAKPFSAPSTQESKFPKAPFGQFNRVTQQAQASAHVSGPSQQNFPVNSFQSQRQPTSSSTRYTQQPAFAHMNPTAPTSGQYQGSTTSSQYNGITQASASSFLSQNQGSTRIPQAAVPTISTSSIRRPSESNKITQASATAFISTAPTSAANFNSQNTFGGRPTFQTTENRFQATQSFSQPQPEQVTSDKESDISPSVATQQYSGEIYEYSKPAEMLPAPSTKPESSAQNQFESSQSRNEQKLEKPRPTFAAPSQNNVRPSYPQYNVQSSFSKDQPTQSVSQSNFQSRPFESQSQVVQESRPQNKDRPNCCQSLDSQIANLESQRVQGVRPVTSRFGSQFPGSNQGSSSFAAEQETFSPHREPPRFDEETGYHY